MGWIFRRLGRFGVAAAAAVGLAAAGAGTGVAAQTFAFERVNVLPMDRPGVVTDQTVVVTDGVITEVGPSDRVVVPVSATRIDATGQFLMPGLAEMHAHVPPVASPPEEVLEEIMFLYVANGVTTIRGMLGSDYQIALARRLERGDMLGPTLYVGAPSINGNSAPDPATADRLIRAHKAAGYDLQKIHPGISRATWDRMVRAADDVGLTFGGHVPADVGVEHALRTGMSTVDHLDGYVTAVAGGDIQSQVNAGAINLDGLKRPRAYDPAITRLVELSRRYDVYVVPTMYLWENLFGGPDPDDFLSLPEMRYVSPQQRQAWRNQALGVAGNEPSPQAKANFFALRKHILKRLADGGVGILMGTDSPQLFNVPGFALHRELDVMEAAGLTRQQILESGTTHVARYVADHLKLDGNFGAVREGNRADLVLLEANPLEDLDHLADRVGVMVRGRWVPRAEIERGLRALEAKHR